MDLQYQYGCEYGCNDSGNACSNAPTCSDTCSQSVCDGNTLYSCADGNGDGCLELVYNQWCAHGCNLQGTACSSAPTCQVELVSPSLGSYTTNFTPVTAGGPCSAGNWDYHSLYRSKVVSVSGNTADVCVKKAGSGGPMSASVDFEWVVLSNISHMSCMDLNSYVTRYSSTWYQGSSEFCFSSSVWPNQASFAAAGQGDTKAFGAVTGGAGGYEHQRVWFQRQPVVFRKVCN